MDTVVKEKRSQIMSRIKNRDSKLELSFRKELWRSGIRYRKNSAKHFGKPDLVMAKYKLVVFLDSCFWHGCKKHCRIPSSRKNYWMLKISRNWKRDKAVVQYYKNNKWKIIRIWEHELKKNHQKFISKIIGHLRRAQ